jgi:TM2 domain-containing membrane protein YozV
LELLNHLTPSLTIMKSKSTAALLAFFLGGFGVHRFYLGQSGKGIAYLLFFWTLIPAFIAFIDFIIFLTMSEDSFNAKYNTTATVLASIRQSSSLEDLEKLHSLKEKGAISAEEYESRKAKILV